MTTVEDAPIAWSVGIEQEEQTPRSRKGRGRLVWLALGAVLVAAAGIGTWLWADTTSTGSTPAGADPVATAVVERGTISATESWDGTLVWVPFTVNNIAGGTVTRVVEQGATVERGAELYRVNERPVILLIGAVPMYRDLARGDAGVDVEQLESNLVDLGYGGFTVDGEYDRSTEDAVRAWQADVGAPQTGAVARVDVVFAAHGGRVDALRVGVGDAAPGAAVFDITGANQVVGLEVDVDDRDRFDVGAQVTVVLPDGEEIPGAVSATKVVAGPSGAAGGSPEGGTPNAESLVQVGIALATRAPDDVVGGPVEVVVPIEERPDVLFVPVNALLALTEGGYGLEVVASDGRSKIVPVDTGLFAGGRVEVSGAGITEGAVVGVAGR